MEGRWGRRVYGSVKRGAKYTRFRLEFTLTNDCVYDIVMHQSNDTLDQYPNLYGWTLDNMLEQLTSRVEARPQ